MLSVESPLSECGQTEVAQRVQTRVVCILTQNYTIFNVLYLMSKVNLCRRQVVERRVVGVEQETDLMSKREGGQ